MGIINKFKTNLFNKEFALFIDEKGTQKDIKKLDIFKNSFDYEKKTYLKDKTKYSNFNINIGMKKYNFFIYDLRFSEPINFNHELLNKSKNGVPFVAKDIYHLLQSKVLTQVNRQDGLFSSLDFKTILIIGGVIIAIIYMVMGGQIV